MTRRTLAVVAALMALLAGCSAAPQPSTSDGLAVRPRPSGVQDPAVVPTGGPGSAASCDPLASLRPDAAMGIPGQAMPAGSTMEAILRRGRLIVGVDQNTYLFGFRDAESGQIEGFDVDIAKAVAAAIFGTAEGHVQLVAITSAQRIPFVNEGKVDLVAHTMTMNCERWAQVNFSSQYYDAGQMVLVPKSSTARGIADLSGKKVCAAAGSTSIQNIARNKARPIPVSVMDWTDCLVMLQQGQVDAISTDDTILSGLAKQDPTTKLVGGKFTSEPYGLAISKKSPDFVRFVNGVLESLRANGGWAAIYRHWIDATAQNPQPPSAKYRD